MLITMQWSPHGDHCYAVITAWWSQHGDHFMVITAWWSPHGDHCYAVITAWWSQHGDHFMVITSWWSLHGDHRMMITAMRWSLHGDHNMVITSWWSLHGDHCMVITTFVCVTLYMRVFIITLDFWRSTQWWTVSCSEWSSIISSSTANERIEPATCSPVCAAAPQDAAVFKYFNTSTCTLATRST